MPKIASKIEPAFAGPAIDADKVGETANAKLMTAKERQSVAPLTADPSLSLVPETGDLGALLFALLDAAGYLGAGLGADGTWSARKVNGLVEVLAPLVTAATVHAGTLSADNITAQNSITKLVSMLNGGAMSIDDRASIRRSQGGERLEIGQTDFQAAITDEAGNVFAGVKDGIIYGPGSTTQRQKSDLIDKLTTTYFNGIKSEVGAHNYDFCISDPNGNVLLGWLDGTFYGPGSTTVEAVLDAQDAKNKAYTARLHAARVTTIQRPTADLNVQAVYGQSLGQGDETWPALSRVNRFGNLMFGGSVQPGGMGTTFPPFGGSASLQPLIAVTISTANTALDGAGEAALAPGNGARGEPINHGWANGSRFAIAQHLLDEDYSKRHIVSINASFSGATIGELEKNHSEGTAERYGRYSDGLAQIKTIATAEGKSMVVAGIAYLQGEHDYFQASGHDSKNISYANYRAKLETMVANMQADAIATTGQALPPPFLIYQTGGSYTRDVDANGVPGMHVGMAQLDVALASDRAWMVGPSYPYTDKGGHLDSNGSRWFGHQFAKVYEHVVLKGRDWEPLRPLRIWKSGASTIYVAYHVPVAPLVLDEPQLSGGTEYNNASRGFRVTDDSGSAAVSDVAIVRDTIIRITCARALGANPKLWYASQGTTGNGMVRDSDPALAIDNYVFEPERGMYASANIAQFVNKPYPLWNWGVGFYLPIEA